MLQEVNKFDSPAHPMPQEVNNFDFPAHPKPQEVNNFDFPAHPKLSFVFFCFLLFSFVACWPQACVG